jgi:DNA polymerase III gamma/tau subunit
MPERERIVALAQGHRSGTVQLCYQIALQGRDDLPLAPDEHAGFLMTLLRMLVFARDVATQWKTSTQNENPQGIAFDGNWARWSQKLPLSGAPKELARNTELRSHANGVFELVVQKTMAHLAGDSYARSCRPR